MSRTQPRAFEMAQLAYPCAYCGVGIGEWCLRGDGSYATFSHQCRYDLAFRNGISP
jgi:hypothetical protein